MSGTKIPDVSILFRETKHIESCVRLYACVTQFLKIHTISGAAVFQVIIMIILYWKDSNVLIYIQ